MKVLKSVFFVILFLGVLGFGGFIYLGQSSKNGQAPGLSQGQLAPCPSSPNCVSSEAGTEPGKRVETLTPGVWDKISATINDMGGTLTVTGDDYIAAEFTSATFGFVDDIEFRRAEDAVHVRSGSRVGYSDAGVNAARVDELRAKLAN